jgi:hypothetical protein
MFHQLLNIHDLTRKNNIITRFSDQPQYIIPNQNQRYLSQEPTSKEHKTENKSIKYGEIDNSHPTQWKNLSPTRRKNSLITNKWRDDLCGRLQNTQTDPSSI